MRTPLPSLIDAAQAWFGPRAEAAVTYAELLATRGVAEGLLGPDEAATVWSRHVINCALVAQLVPAGSRVIDLGSGAGLPGIPVAMARADLTVTLVEPMARRIRFLADVRDALAGAVPLQIVRARSEALRPGSCDLILARAVAPLPRLIPLVLPGLRPGGRLLALKGRSAAQEVADVRPQPEFTIRTHELRHDEHTATVVDVTKRPRPPRGAR